METLRQLDLMNCQTLTCSAEDFLAKVSALLASEEDSRDILLGKIKTLRKGWALGRCEIQGHALLCFIDTDSKLWLLDNNKSIREPKEKEILRIEF